jgi:hypothetical protein
MLASCKEVKRQPVGSPYEVLVVCDEAFWDSDAGKALTKALRIAVPGLPQKEASLKIIKTKEGKLNSTNEAYRNIILVDIGSNHSKSELRFEKDVYASPQVVMAIYSPSEKEFAQYVSRNAQVIVDFFSLKERERQISSLYRKSNRHASSLIKKKFDCDMKIPSDIAGYKQGRNFLWFSDYNNPSKVEMLSFAVYSYPYNGPEDFSKENFIHMRDSMMMENIQGGEPGQFIKTDAESVTLSEEGYDGKYMSIARGLWYMENDIMGGPFVSHSIVDEVHNRMVVVEAFVYAPNKLKRNFMRKLEASLYTLELPKEQEEASAQQAK